MEHSLVARLPIVHPNVFIKATTTAGCLVISLHEPDHHFHVHIGSQCICVGAHEGSEGVICAIDASVVCTRSTRVLQAVWSDVAEVLLEHW